MDTRQLRLILLLCLLLSAACISPRDPDGSGTAQSPEEAMLEGVYTLGVWRVKPGREAEFITAWKELGRTFAQLPQPPSGRGTLIQSLSDPTLFYSFGPWKRLEDVEAMRANARAQEGIRRLMELCTEATPGSFQVVAESQ